MRLTLPFALSCLVVFAVPLPLGFLRINTPSIPLPAGYSVEVRDSELELDTPDNRMHSAPLLDVYGIAIFATFGPAILFLAYREDRQFRAGTTQKNDHVES